MFHSNYGRYSVTPSSHSLTRNRAPLQILTSRAEVSSWDQVGPWFHGMPLLTVNVGTNFSLHSARRSSFPSMRLIPVCRRHLRRYVTCICNASPNMWGPETYYVVTMFSSTRIKEDEYDGRRNHLINQHLRDDRLHGGSHETAVEPLVPEGKCSERLPTNEVMGKEALLITHQ